MGLTASIGIDKAEAADKREDAERIRLLEELMLAYQKRVFGVALRMLGEAHEAASAAQDCFLHAYRAMASCPSDDPGRRRWLLRIVSNLCVDRLRSRKWLWWKRRLGLESAGAQPAAALASPDRELLARETTGRLSSALVCLSPRQRAVFVLRHYEGLPIEEVAAQLGLNTGTVKVHLSRAIDSLREELKDFYGKRPPDR